MYTISRNKYIHVRGTLMDEAFWIRFLPSWQKSKAESKSSEIKFVPKLRLTRDGGCVFIELLLRNRSAVAVWAEDATVALTHFDVNRHTGISRGQARLAICQNVTPDEALSVSVAEAIYDAADRPQGRYSCLVLTNVRYRVFDGWRDARLETYRVEMVALTVVGLHRARWYGQNIKQINGSVSLRTKEHKG
jgi:hypothetical protein